MMLVDVDMMICDMAVKSFGKVLNNADETAYLEGQDRSSAPKIKVASQFKFGFALESEITPDYVSEKVQLLECPTEICHRPRWAGGREAVDHGKGHG
jgi:hypothetical protein